MALIFTGQRQVQYRMFLQECQCTHILVDSPTAAQLHWHEGEDLTFRIWQLDNAK